MSQVLVITDSSKVLSQLDAYNYTVPQAGTYNVSVQMSEIPPSGLSIVIQQNSVSKASSAAPSAAQSNMNLQISLNCSISDVLSVVLSSSQASDKQLNVVKGIVNIQRVG